MDADLMRQLGGAGGAGMPSAEEAQAQAEARRAAEEQRQAMLTAIMMPSARERLSRIALVKPEKAKSVEDMIIMMARQGRLAGKVDDESLITLLDKVGEHSGEKKETKITFVRRRMDDDW